MAAFTCRRLDGRQCGHIHHDGDECCYSPEEGGHLERIPERDASGVMRAPDGRKIAVPYRGPALEAGDGKYLIDCGGCAAYGELFMGPTHDYREEDTVETTGIIDPVLVDRKYYAAKARSLSMSDGEYELAIGEGMPPLAAMLLAETTAGKKARGKLGVA